MALCHGCNRILSANGSCLYCGTTSGRETVEGGVPRRRRANWTRRILMLAFGGLAFHFFFITPTGRGILKPLIDAIGLSKYFTA